MAKTPTTKKPAGDIAVVKSAAEKLAMLPSVLKSIEGILTAALEADQALEAAGTDADKADAAKAVEAAKADVANMVKNLTGMFGVSLGGKPAADKPGQGERPFTAASEIHHGGKKYLAGEPINLTHEDFLGLKEADAVEGDWQA